MVKTRLCLLCPLFLALLFEKRPALAHWHTHARANHDDYDASSGAEHIRQCEAVATPFKTELSKYSLTYPHLDKGLAIYTDLQIPCNGYLTEWHFLSAVTVVWGLHLAVFRPLSHNHNEFKLLHETYVNGMTTRSFGDTWAVLNLQDPLAVRTGDVLGAYYDRNVTLAYGALSLRSMGRIAPRRRDRHGHQQNLNPNTIIFPHTAEDLRQSNGIVRKPEGRMAERLPGLYIMLQSLAPKPQASTTTTLPPTPPPTPPPTIPQTRPPPQPIQRPRPRPNLPQFPNYQLSLSERPLSVPSVAPSTRPNRRRLFNGRRSTAKPQRGRYRIVHQQRQTTAGLIATPMTHAKVTAVPKKDLMPPVQYHQYPPSSSIRNYRRRRRTTTTTTATRAWTYPTTTAAPPTSSETALPATLAPYPTKGNYVPIPRDELLIKPQTRILSKCYGIPVYYNCAQLSIRFYYDSASDICRQYLYCASSPEGEQFGFKTNSACMATCGTRAQVSTAVAMTRRRPIRIRATTSTTTAMPTPKAIMVTTEEPLATTEAFLLPKMSKFDLPEDYKNYELYENDYSKDYPDEFDYRSDDMYSLGDEAGEKYYGQDYGQDYDGTENYEDNYGDSEQYDEILTTTTTTTTEVPAFEEPEVYEDIENEEDDYYTVPSVRGQPSYYRRTSARRQKFDQYGDSYIDEYEAQRRRRHFLLRQHLLRRRLEQRRQERLRQLKQQRRKEPEELPPPLNKRHRATYNSKRHQHRRTQVRRPVYRPRRRDVSHMIVRQQPSAHHEQIVVPRPTNHNPSQRSYVQIATEDHGDGFGSFIKPFLPFRLCNNRNR